MEASLAAWGCRLRIESEAEEPDLEVWKAVHDIEKEKSCKMPQDLHALVERLPYVICRRVVIRALLRVYCSGRPERRTPIYLENTSKTI